MNKLNRIEAIKQQKQQEQQQQQQQQQKTFDNENLKTNNNDSDNLKRNDNSNSLINDHRDLKKVKLDTPPTSPPTTDKFKVNDIPRPPIKKDLINNNNNNDNDKPKSPPSASLSSLYNSKSFAIPLKNNNGTTTPPNGDNKNERNPSNKKLLEQPNKLNKTSNNSHSSSHSPNNNSSKKKNDESNSDDSDSYSDSDSSSYSDSDSDSSYSGSQSSSSDEYTSSESEDEKKSPNKNKRSIVKSSTTTSTTTSTLPKKVTTEYITDLISQGKTPISKIAVLIQYSREKNFKFLSTNLYLERRERILDDDDDIDICNCLNIDGDCGEECINRKSYIECDVKHCDVVGCRNQRFQRKLYSPIEPFHAGPKGWGLRATQDIKKKDFIIEYCGEVITKATCINRMQKAENEKFFYFLTLDAKECLDASKKGNHARFINHSCDPNCETQKWNVGGEVKIGIFAIKDIPNGTELTFDYNYERFGASKQICYCGSSNCRGYLGEKSSKKAIISSSTLNNNNSNNNGSNLNGSASNGLSSSTSTSTSSNGNGSTYLNKSKSNKNQLVPLSEQMLVFNHQNHAKFLLNEKVDDYHYQSELSAESENHIIVSKKLFLSRNVRMLKLYYLNFYKSCLGSTDVNGDTDEKKSNVVKRRSLSQVINDLKKQVK
ncbi:hypothetical protein CYY_006235 [Polysphondylium violaceum]|uniref:SET domain-containing protein n=1 Tax=Polysphondylium violaceum TaxID=133409 RepID=A0A8J4PSJ8_9MYCE|nr:hypothetical protein CYY_006235 [Polysphondylium violaceum]